MATRFQAARHRAAGRGSGSIARRAARCTVATAALLCGAAIGGVVAKPAVLHLQTASLWQAMRAVHRTAGLNAIYLHEKTPARSLDIQVTTASSTGDRVAKMYGRDLVQLGRVAVLLPSLPDTAPGDRVTAARRWAESDCGRLDALRAAQRRSAKSLHDRLGEGTFSLNALGASDREAAYSLLRDGDTGLAGALIQNVFDIDSGRIQYGRQQ